MIVIALLLMLYQVRSASLTDCQKQQKIEINEGFSLTLIPGDGHCISYCFGVDMVFDLLETEFHENISVYTTFSTFSDDKI